MTRGRQNGGKKKVSHIDDVDPKPDRERIPLYTLEHLRVSDLPSRRRRHLLLLLGRRRGKIPRYRGQRLAPRGRIRAAAGRVIIRLERGRDVVESNRGRVGRNVEERGRVAALRRVERGGGGSGRGAIRWSAGQFLLLFLLFVRASVHAHLARAVLVLVLVLVLATHAKRELRRLANDPRTRAPRAASAFSGMASVSRAGPGAMRCRSRVGVCSRFPCIVLVCGLARAGCPS